LVVSPKGKEIPCQWKVRDGKAVIFVALCVDAPAHALWTPSSGPEGADLQCLAGDGAFDAAGLPAGSYIVRLSAGEMLLSRRLLILRRDYRQTIIWRRSHEASRQNHRGDAGRLDHHPDRPARPSGGMTREDHRECRLRSSRTAGRCAWPRDTLAASPMHSRG
jgi:hypothetical protein